MPKGFCQFLLAMVLICATMNLAAQVYRCETGAGVVYSDIPCSENAEEVDLDVLEPASDPQMQMAPEASASAVPEQQSQEAVPTTEAAPPQAETRPAIAEGEGNIVQFLRMLQDQREQQIGEIDRELTALKARAASDEFASMDEAQQAALLAEIDQQETSRAAILSEYSALIAEAESRLEE